MKNLVLVKKYAEGLARALEGEAEYGSVEAEVRVFLDLFLSHRDLKRALVSPSANARKRDAILADVLTRLGTGPKASRFLSLLQHHKRIELLPEIFAALPEAWSESRGIVTYEVASAVPLTAVQRDRLAANLEASEKKPVRLVLKTDPALVGGVAVRKGHIVYDASIEGELGALQERLGHE